MSASTDPVYAHCVYQVFTQRDAVELCFSDHYLAYCAAGSMNLEVDRQYIFLQPTKAAWIPAGKRVKASIPNSITCCSILFSPTQFPKHPSIVQLIELSPLARQMILHCRQWDSIESSDNKQARHFFKALSDVLIDRMDEPTSDWIPRGESTLVSQAVDMTIKLSAENLEIGDIASELAVSQSTLSRRFVEETGMTWSSILRRARILKARELLAATDAQITSVAADVGYSSQSAFNRAFKQETGMTPREFVNDFRSCTIEMPVNLTIE